MSKLGPHAIGGTPSTAAMINAGCKIVKMTDGFDATALARSKNVPTIIGRRIIPYANQNGRVITAENQRHKDPREAAQELVDALRDTFRLNPDIKIWEGHNEPVWGSLADMAWYAEHEAWRMKLLADLGLRACFGNFATGNPDMSFWSAFRPAFEAARRYNAIFGLHEYGGTWMWWMTGKYQLQPTPDGDEGWTTLRYRKVYRQNNIFDIPLAITECGLDAVHPPRPGFKTGNWRSMPSEWEKWNGADDPIDYWRAGGRDPEVYYAEQLKWYDKELQKDSYVLGATIFTLGGANWGGHDINNTRVASNLVSYIASDVNTTPNPNPNPDPNPEPEEPNEGQPIMLRNPSFEGATYTRSDNQSSLFPEGWEFSWADRDTPRLNPNAPQGQGRQDQDWLKPEIITRGYQFINEGRALVHHGDIVLKLFKGQSPVWIKMWQTVELDAGQHKFWSWVFPDQVSDYIGYKHYPVETNSPDWYLASEFKLTAVIDGVEQSTGWLDARTVGYGVADENGRKPGKWNKVELLISVAAKKNVRLEIEMRGRWGFKNNGWWVDDCGIERVSNPNPVPDPDVDFSVLVSKVALAVQAVTVAGQQANAAVAATQIAGQKLSEVQEELRKLSS
jgi:hypothetical protein